MRRLILRHLRPYLATAGGAGIALNLALLTPSAYILALRHLGGGDAPLLWVLSAVALAAIVFAFAAERVRAAALARAGRALELLLAPAAVRDTVRFAATGTGRRRVEVLRDIGHLQTFLTSSAMLAVFDAPWILIYLIFIALLHPLLGLTVLADALFLVTVALPAEQHSRRYAEVAARCHHESHDHARALARCANTIVGMGMSEAALESWQLRHRELLDAQERLAQALSRLTAAARMSRQASQVVVLSLGAWLVFDQRSSPVVVIAAALLMARAQQPVEQLVNGWRAMIDARGAWGRLGLDANDAEGAERAAAQSQGRITMAGVSYAPMVDAPVLLEDLSIDIERGESVGIIGRSGAGKTTLLRLLLGILSPCAGSISLYDADPAAIGYLPQGPEFMPGTVAENIARLNLVDRDQVEHAARLANAHEMIAALPLGYDTPMGDGNLRLSGGQRQRIALARALYGSPTLVVLDEPYANLDAAGESALAQTLRQLKHLGVTLIVVSHRSRLLRDFDRLLVLEAGRLADVRRKPLLDVKPSAAPAHCA